MPIVAAPVLYVYLKGGEDSVGNWITEGMADPVGRRDKINAHLALVGPIPATPCNPTYVKEGWQPWFYDTTAVLTRLRFGRGWGGRAPCHVVFTWLSAPPADF